jgi:hypothetical protein
MRHEPNASLQLHTRCKIKTKGNETKQQKERWTSRTKTHAHRVPNRHAPLSASTDHLRRRHEWDPVAGLGTSFKGTIIYALSLYHPCYHNTRFAATLQSNLRATASAVARVCRVQMSCQSRIVSQELPATSASRRLDSAMGCLHERSSSISAFACLSQPSSPAPSYRICITQVNKCTCAVNERSKPTYCMRRHLR